MAIQITNLLDSNFSVPEPTSEPLQPRATVQYPNASYADVINDARFTAMETARQILIENLEPGRRETLEATTADLNLWVATTGSDDNAGSEQLPYRTAARALRDVPFRIDHNVHIRFQPGTHTSFPDYVYRRCSPSGTLYLEGLGAPVASAGPFTVDAFAKPGNAYGTIEVTGAGWTTDEFYDKWVRVTVGTYPGVYAPVFKNTTDTIFIPWASLGTVTEVEIVDGPLVEIAPADGSQKIVFDTGLIGNGPSLVLAGMAFKHSAYGKVTLLTSEVFTAFTKFETPDNSAVSNSYTMKCHDSNVNMVSPVDTSVLDTAAYNNFYSGKFLASKGSVVWTGGTARGAALNGTCRVFGLCDRFITQVFWSSVCFTSGCACGATKIYEWSTLAAYYCLFDHAAATFTYPPVLAEGNLILQSCHIGGSNTGYGILTGTGGAAEFNDLGGDAGLTYGAWIAAGSHVRVYGTVSLTGATDDFKWDVDDTAGSWPTGGAVVTDTKGAFVYHYNR